MSILGFNTSTFSRVLRNRVAMIDRLKFLKVNSQDSQEDLTFRMVMDYINNVMMTRNVEFRVYEDFFAGGENHKIYFKKFSKETDDAYFARLDKSVVSNKCKRIVNKGAQFLYATPPERRMEDDEAHKRIMDTWEFNHVMSGFFHLTLAIESQLYGFQLVRNQYVRKSNQQPIFAKVGQNDGTYEVKYIPLHPMLSIPVPRVNAQHEMGAVILLTMDVQEQPLLGVDTPQIRYVDYVDDESWLRWKVDWNDNATEITGTQIDVQFGQYLNKHPYGNVNVLFTLYRNAGGSMYVMDGNSDLTDIVELQTKYNETLSDDGHVIANHTFPLLLFTGMIVEKDFKRGVADVLSSRNNDAEGRYITWDTNLEASGKFSVRLTEDIREASGYSPVSDGRLDNIGQVRNLRAAMVPDIATISQKQVFYRKAEMEHASATLSMIEWHEAGKYPNKKLEMTFSEDYIPVDELAKVQAQSMSIDSGIEDLRQVIRDRHPELETDAEIDERVQETLDLMERVSKAKQSGKVFNQNPAQSSSQRQRSQNNGSV